MERYKCVKKYPGGPDKGTVVYHPHRYRAWHDEYFKMKNDRRCINHIFFSEDQIKDFPEFWKKIKTRK